jgi:hypothetical protein
MDAWTLARLAGHSNIRQSMTYVHPSDRALHAAIDRMSLGGDKSWDSAKFPVSGSGAKLIVVETTQKS